ncbi:ATP-binding protein [Mesorhizobium sp. IMUNJ 23232]|uniref:ATP-binding protein n=1 Tax=Mesorhizobium sp. IMUNJ 23232 TaxID=3376064 RepID=UPI00379421B4
MPSAAYSFIDVAVLDGVRERFAAGDAIVILSTDLAEVVWANGPGAALFGHADIERIVGAESGLGFAARRQIMATKGFPNIGRDRAITVRLAQGLDSRAMGFSASAVVLPDGEKAIMLAVPAGLAGAPETEIAARAIGGFTEPGHLVAFLDGRGAVEAASPNFFAREIPTQVLAGLVADVAGEADRLVKKIISTGSSRFPAGIARLRDNPARHLLVMIDEEQAADTSNAPTLADEGQAAIAEAAPVVEQAVAVDMAEAAPKGVRVDLGQPNASEPDAASATVSAEPATNADSYNVAVPVEPVSANADAVEERPVVESAVADDLANDHPVPSIDDVWGPQDVAQPVEPAAAAGIMTPPANEVVAADWASEPTFEIPAAETPTAKLEGHAVAEQPDDSATADAEAESAPAAVGKESGFAALSKPPIARPVAVDRSAAPVRFVWKTDAVGRFSAVSPEFLAGVGARADDIIGKPFAEVSNVLRLDPQGEIAGLLERRDTWSGRSVLWPIAGTDLKVPVDLAALPIYSRDRSFEGFRGFGVARLADSVVDLDAVGLTLGSAASPADPAPEAEPTADSAERPVEPKASESRSADPFQGEVPALSIAPKLDRRSSDKIIRLAEHRPPVAEKGLSNVERSAFREIGERLRKTGGIEDLPEAGNANGARQSGTEAAVAAMGTAANDSVATTAEQMPGEVENSLAVEPVNGGEAHASSAATISMEPAADVGAAADPTAAEASAATQPQSYQTAAVETIADAAREPTGDLVTPDAGAAGTGATSEHPARAGQAPELTTQAAREPEAAAADTIVVDAGEPPASLADASRFQPVAEPAWQELPAHEGHTHADTISIDGSRAEQSDLPETGTGTVADQEPSPATGPTWQEAHAEAETVSIDSDRTEQPESPIESGASREPQPALASEVLDDADADTVSIHDTETGSLNLSASGAGIIPGHEPSHGAEPAWQEANAREADADTVSIDSNRTEQPERPQSPVEPGAGREPQPQLASHVSDETEADADTISIDDAKAESPDLPASTAEIVAGHETPEPTSDVSDAVEAPAIVSPVAAARAAIAELKTGGFMPSAFSSSPDSGKRFQDTAILSRLPVPLLIHSGDVLHYANDEFLNLTGYGSLDALREVGGLGALFSDPYQDDARDGTGRSLRMRTADDMEFPIEALLRSVPWSGGHALMLVVRRTGEAVDVSDDEAPLPQQPDVEALKARVSEMRAIIDTATDGVILITHDGMIRSISRPAEALFGFDTDDVSGKPFVSLFAMESQRAARDYLNGLSDHGVASVLNDGREVIGREAQGRFIPLFMTIGKLPNDSGYCAVVRDITQWKRAEEELTQARSVAERASSQKSDFLARISHEIRTPLNAIIGFSELMIDERFGAIGNDRYRDYLLDINRSGNHVLELVNDLLDISKIEAGEQEMAYEAVSLNETLGQTVAMMQPQANRERVIIRSSFASRLPDIVADARSVRQIALNLLSNAVRYTQAGGQVIVSTSYEPSGDVVMRVRDTGIGMTQAEIEQALKPFKQINTLKRSRGDGTGLGLPLTKAMVEANRARFTINSTPGEGTLVEVTFPSTRVLAN